MRPVLLVLISSLMSTAALAAGPDFSGTWTIDLRTTEQRKRNAECGSASFELKQTGDQIVGDHTFATADCGRLNEGGEGTVKGVVVGNSAVLVVTSGRNGAIIMGKATRTANRLRWVTLQEIKAVEGDSALILSKGVLTLAK